MSRFIWRRRITYIYLNHLRLLVARKHLECIFARVATGRRLAFVDQRSDLGLVGILRQRIDGLLLQQLTVGVQESMFFQQTLGEAL